MKIKNIYRILGFFACSFVFSNPMSSYALNASPYKMPGIDSIFWDEDVPPTLILNSSGDGLAKGTILYRKQHKGVDYYTPIAPKSIESGGSDPNKGRYNNWGPWNMPSNKTSRGITSTFYYPSVKTKSKAKVYTDTGNGSTSDSQYIGSLNSGTNIEVLSISNGWIYFETNKHPSLQKKGVTGVGRVSTSNISYTSSKMSLVFSGYGGNSLLQNFKPVGKYTDNMRSAHKGISPGVYKNPSRSDVPSSVRGKSGEWRYLGYNADGEPLDNPYFIADSTSFQTVSYPYGYPWRFTPWNPKDKKESGESNQASAYERFTIGAKTFKYDKEARYSGLKKGMVDKLVNLGYIKSASDYKDRFSLRTHPEKQGILIMGQRKNNNFYRTGFVPLDSGLRDLYIKRLTVKDGASGKTIATTTCSISGSCSIGEGRIEKGKSYKVEAIISNGADSYMLKDVLEAQIGYTYNKSINSVMPFNSTSNRKALKQTGKGGLTNRKDSESKPFNDTLNVESNRKGTIDVYGYVGGSHTGVDNLNYDNDVAVVRLKTDDSMDPPINPDPPDEPDIDNPVTGCETTSSMKICGGGDIRPLAIKLFDEGGNLVYWYDGTVRTRKAIIPGKKYKVAYSAKYYGQTIEIWDLKPGYYRPVSVWQSGYYDSDGDWVSGYWTTVQEWVPSEWINKRTKEYTVPLNWSLTKYSGGPRDRDTKTWNNKGVFYLSQNKSDTTIPMYSGVEMGYEATLNGEQARDLTMYQHPYLDTNFKVMLKDNRANGYKSNDYMSHIIQDEFDLSISNLKATPVTSFIGDSSQNVTFNISYDANLATPNYVSKDDYQASVNTAININGKTIYVKDQILKGGTPSNGKITHIVKDVPVSNAGSVNVNVNLNYDKLSYETGNYNNNLSSTKANVVKVKNPGLGNPSETVKPTDNSNNNNANKGGDANNNCLTPRTKNTWTSTHRKFMWNSTDVNYKKISNGQNVSFKQYKTTYENLNEATETYQEDFGIEKIMFKSKETTNDKRGSNNDGWINLLDSDESKYAEIKAGYGFELKIMTKYSTNALTKRTWNLSNNGSNGTAVSALNGGPNYGIEEVFLELPGTSNSDGTKGTRKILSVSGYASTVSGLNVSKNVNSTTGEANWIYTIKPKDTVSIGDVPKIFIPEKTKDGDYKLKIYTSPLSGASSLNKKTYSALCDRKEVTIKVKGSSTGDLNSHETQ